MIQKKNRNEEPEILELKDDTTRKSIFENGLRSYSVSGYTIETKNEFDAIITKQNRLPIIDELNTIEELSDKN